ncbi:MAG: ECF transporter S component [Armatimonadota bacterium]|nr:ECF transporter S component [Armatimonadota bacterium]MDR5702794.1 ECF transporter S component [Armatimonadota bacterium]
MRILILLAMLAAVAFLLMATVQFPVLPAAPYLKYDPSDVVALFTAITLGPAQGVAVVALKDLLFLILRAGNIFGPTADFLAAATFAGVTGWVYRSLPRRNLGDLGLACAIGVLARILMMIPANFLILFLEFGMPPTKVASLLVPVIIPFNGLKGVINGGLTMALAGAMVRRGLLHVAREAKSQE